MLLFKKKFIEAIREGRKTQTVRFATSCRFRAGQRSYIPGVGYIRIESIEQTSLEALSDADALADGFANADLLRAELKQLYPDRLGKEYLAFKIKFQVLPPEEQSRIVAEREQRKRRENESSRESRAEWFEKTMKKIGDLATSPKVKKRNTVRKSRKKKA